MRMRRKKWTEPVIADCPYYVEAPSTHRGQWRALFPNAQKLWLEIGCGKGVGTVQMAYDNRDANLIAIDEVRHVLAVSIQNTKAQYGDLPVDNLRFSAVDATRIFDTFCKEDGIERIYIHFCNPWNEKAKHHKRRLTHPRQLMQYREFLQDGGEIYLKTDDSGLFLASKRYFAECGFQIVYQTDDLHASGFSPNYVSEHEALYTSRGCPIHFCIAKMLPSEFVQTPVEP